MDLRIQQVGERCLTGTRRPGKNDRTEATGIDHSTEQFAFAKDLLLSHQFGKPAWPHPGGERLNPLQIFFFHTSKEGLVVIQVKDSG